MKQEELYQGLGMWWDEMVEKPTATVINWMPSTSFNNTSHTYMGTHLSACLRNVSSMLFPWGAASKRKGNDEDAAGYCRNARRRKATQGFRTVACAIEAPMLESDSLLELLLAERCLAALTLSSTTCQAFPTQAPRWQCATSLSRAVACVDCREWLWFMALQSWSQLAQSLHGACA